MLALRAREATGLSQSAFARRYGLHLATLRDWEQGRKVPDTAAQSYLRVILKIPEEVANAVGSSPRSRIMESAAESLSRRRRRSPD
ncbi:MAG: helix-turn-helix domain-containing protein [Rhodospirillaceae bacterium]|nr:helix-turn-helix domain-containing protein [Rhodospirillaceae bacterium]